MNSETSNSVGSTQKNGISLNGDEASVSVLMVRYLQPELEARAIQSVKKHTDLERHKFYIMDNGQLDMNLGALWNRMVLSIQTPYVCLLNSDVEVTENWLERLLEGIQKTEADAIGPMTDRCGNRIQVGSPSSSNSLVSVSQLSGFCLLLNREAFLKCGGFREDFGFYGQESNLMDRLKKKVLHKGVFVRHKARGSWRADRDWLEEKQYSVEVYKKNREFDWKKKLLILGAATNTFKDNPFPLWRGINHAVVEFKRQGMRVEHVPFDGSSSEISQSVAEFGPDAVIVACTNPSRLLRLLKPVRQSVGSNVPIGLWYNDLRPGSFIAKVGNVRGCVDRLFLCWSEVSGEYSHAAWSSVFGCPASYMPQGGILNSTLKFEKFNRNHEVVFIGGLYPNSSLYGTYRIEMVRNIGAKMINSFERRKRGEIERWSSFIYRAHKYCLSTSPLSIPGYQSIRLYNILSYGGLALVDEFPGLDGLFRHGKHILKFKHRDSVDARRVMKEWREKSEECEVIRRNGWRLQQAKHNVGYRLLNITHSLLTGNNEFWGWL